MSGRSYQSEVPLLEVRNLTISHAPSGRVLVGPLSLTLRAGECLALVGDSGSGKSLTLRALLRLLPSELSLSADALLSRGRSLARAGEREWNELRGAEVALVQQDTGLALDPLRRIEREVREAALVSARRSRVSLQDFGPGFVTDQLRESGLPAPEEFLRRWPHQLSGGQRQRVVLASSLSAAPGVLLADEPTTALDAVAQDAVLARLETFVRQGGGLLLVSHDEAVVRRLADRVLYLEDGELRDTRAHSPAPTRPVHPVRRAAPATPLCEARALSYKYESGRGIADLSIRLDAGAVVGLLGPSGSGKTTFAKALTGLLPGVRGEVTLDGLDWLQLPERTRRRNRWRMQWVPQDPLASFPRGRTVAGILDEALHCHGHIDSGTPRRARLRPREDMRRSRNKLLDAVGLDHSIADRKPATLSGGQRQRVAIARALAVKPRVLICDEPISALDARAQDGILDLLRAVASRDDCAVLFISHDNRAVRSISDRVLLLHDGHIIDAPD